MHVTVCVSLNKIFNFCKRKSSSIFAFYGHLAMVNDHMPGTPRVNLCSCCRVLGKSRETRIYNLSSFDRETLAGFPLFFAIDCCLLHRLEISREPSANRGLRCTGI